MIIYLKIMCRGIRSLEVILAESGPVENIQFSHDQGP